MDLKQDEIYMQMAIDLAKKAVGHTSPNPMVGCVIVKDGKIIASGLHEKYGEFHAERNAINSCKEDLEGSELYVTLEPCCHKGKTPPCTEIIIEKKIKRVVVGCLDVNPLVAEKGIRILKEEGILVDVGILEEECKKLNEVFFYYMSTNLPFVAMKYAMTLDGKISTNTGDSKWITSEKAREHVHKLRNKYSAIMVGIDTVIADDPMLNCRIENGKNPIRIICDSKLRIPLESNIVKSAKKIKTIVVHCVLDKGKQENLESLGIELIRTDGTNKVNMLELMKVLGNKKIDSILVEGGGTIHASLLEGKLINKIYAYIAPKIVGGIDAKTPISGNGINLMANAVKLDNRKVDFLDDDILISGDVRR